MMICSLNLMSEPLRVFSIYLNRPNVAVPGGMVAKTVTTTYSDGRQVTVTEYQPAAATETHQGTPNATTSQYHAPRVDLGSRPVNLTCPYCTQTRRTRIIHQCGDVSSCQESK